MGLLDYITEAVDARKRYYANLGRGLLSMPQETLDQLRAQNAENVRDQARAAQETQSVMPEVAEPARRAAFDQAMNAGLLGITVYHGSPHKFDKFDMSKIGTGEGAQAYGHGLYFAEAPEVAKQYQDALKWRGADWNDAQVIAAQAAEKYGSREAASESLKWALSQNSKSPNPMQAKSNEITKRAISILDDLVTPLSGKPPSPGNFYKVDIPDEAVAKMLDWDKPLSQQPKAVRKALGNVAPMALTDGMSLAGGGNLRITHDPDFGPKYFLEMGGSKMRLNAADVKNLVGSGLEGKSLYQGLKAKLGSDDKVSAYLKQQGIPGIRYLDAGSRGKGGTSNFVLFDDQLPKIIGRE